MTAPTIHDSLVEARALIANPATWTQDAYARDVDGTRSIDWLSARSVCFCSLGAINRATGLEDHLNYQSSHTYRVERLLDEVVSEKTQGLYGNIVAYNDASGRTHEEVLAVFDLAIAKSLETER